MSLPPRLQLQLERTDFVPHVTIEFPEKDGRNFTVARRGTEAGEPPLELGTGGFQHRPVGDKPERRARHGLCSRSASSPCSCTGIGRLIGSVNDPDRPSPIWGASRGRSDPCPQRSHSSSVRRVRLAPVQPLPNSFTTAAAAASWNAFMFRRPSLHGKLPDPLKPCEFFLWSPIERGPEVDFWSSTQDEET